MQQRSEASGDRPRPTSRGLIARRATSRAATPRQVELLDALCNLALAEGFAHLTLDDIAGRLRCSKSTLYALAASKDQLARELVRHYFRTATDRVEERVAAADDARDRVVTYLTTVAEQLRPASREFLDDVARLESTRELYELNARAAAERIRELIRDGVASGVFRDVHAPFVAEMVGLTITGIQSGEVGRRTGLSDAEAFAELAAFVLAALTP